MGYNILIIEKPEEFYYGDYNRLLKYVAVINEVLINQGHKVVFRKDLEMTSSCD